MPILFSCPHCGLKTNVADEFAGQSGPCTRCGQTVVVPASAGAKQRTAPWVAGEATGQVVPSPRSRWRRATPWVALLTLALCCGGPAYVFIIEPVVGAYREHGEREVCSVRMQQIAQALLAYHQDHQTLPPAYLTDAAGAPAHSWRALLLPYLGEKELYEEYEFSEAWDGPKNRLLHGRMPQVFACPSDPATGGLTAYVAVVGSGFAFDRAKSIKLAEFTDRPSDTILLVECSGLRIHWMEPRDLEDGKIEYNVNETPASVLRSHHRDGAFACLADGSPEYFEEGTPIDEIKPRFTIAGQD